MKSLLIDIKEVASRMGLSYQLLQEGMQNDAKNGTHTVPFGNAIQGKKSWRYVVVRARFEKYMNGDDMIIDTSEQNANLSASEQIDIRYIRNIIDEKLVKSAPSGTNNELSQTEEQKLREFCEYSKNSYYTVYDAMKILGCSYDYVREFCKKGKLKAINPDGHKWFIEKKAFDNLDPEVIPEKCRKRFAKYVKSLSG